MGKFPQCLTELSACDTIMVGYYSLMFLLFFMCPVAKCGHIVFALSVCWFIGWTTLTLVITFEPFELEPSYLVCRFLVTSASHSYKQF